MALVQRDQEQVPRGCAQLRGLNHSAKLGGQVAKPILKFRPFLMALVLCALVLTINIAIAQTDRGENSSDLTTPIEPPTPDINETQIITELLTHNQLRTAALLGYTEQRTYEVTDMSGKVHAQEIGQLEY